MSVSGYDIIGDIHGQGERLDLLLDRLGYRGFRHPDGRKIVFLGDFIDRGTEHARTLDTVRRLVADRVALAVMGNHEFNAICYTRKGRRGHIRPRTAENTAQHQLFLDEFPLGSDRHGEAIRWFRQLPVYLDLPEFSVVHACWNRAALHGVAPFLDSGRRTLKSAGYVEYDRRNSAKLYRHLNVLLKGPEYSLPKGVTFEDASGQARNKTRLLWWGAPPFVPSDAPANQLVEKGDLFPPLLGDDRKHALRLRETFHYAAEKPVFIGHYNIPQAPYLTASNVACVNFKGYLVAYRWNTGDKGLDPSRFVYV